MKLKLDKLVLRNISLTALLIAVLIVVILLRTRTPFGRENTAFASVPQNEITRIEFSQKGEKLLLEKKRDSWMVNGRNEARRSGIAFMERILTGIKIKSPVSADLFEAEIVKNNVNPLKVRVFENNKLLNSFLVYKTGSNLYGNIMKLTEKSKPFIVYVPGFEGDIGSGFTMNELFWLPYTIFNSLPSEISSVTYDNISDPDSSFVITGRKNAFSLTDPSNGLIGCDSSRIKRYISYFGFIPFESWALDLPEEKSKKIKSGTPLCRIGIVKSDGSEKVLTLWDKMNEETGEKDSDRLWGKTGEREELFIVRYFDIDPLLKKRSYFFTE
jgi:hypothetical protein